MSTWYRTYGRWALLLGFLQGLSPFAIDMYLPAMPWLARDLQAPVASVQASLMAFIVALGVAQWVYGPLSDMVGRRKPLWVGLTLYVAGSLGCAWAPDIGTLVMMRFVQGIGACAVVVIPRAVVRDLLSGHEAAKLMALLMLVFSISPMLAPYVGTLVMEPWGWRAAFWVLMLAGVLGLYLVVFQLKETHPPSSRTPLSWMGTVRAYRQVLVDRHFWVPALVGAFSFSAFLNYLAHSAFVFMDTYGWSAKAYSLVFAVNAFFFIGGAQVGPRLAKRFGLLPQARWATTFFMGVAVLHAGLQTWFSLTPEVLAVGLWLTFLGLGLILPATSVMAMDAQPRLAGTASSMMGSMQFLLGAAMVGVLSLLGNKGMLTMLWGMVFSAVMAWALARWVLKAPAPAPVRQ